ncbi:hypothetical protein [Salipiger mucosus]|uniref:hypothetical protein n=1 Tax=Salipiger mucosus TaxID=263378 RepID=UPI0012EB55BC|nr:hypothetical protein [Salipiger mucosus]
MTKATSFSSMMQRRHLGVSRALGYALTLGTHEAWSDFRRVIAIRLSEEECAGLAFWALRSLSDDHAAATMQAVADLLDIPSPAGAPIAPLGDLMDQAAFWADMADPAEAEAYCLCTFNRMPSARQAAFLDYVQGRNAA